MPLSLNWYSISVVFTGHLHTVDSQIRLLPAWQASMGKPPQRLAHHMNLSDKQVQFMN